jgi:hypothetical protein
MPLNADRVASVWRRAGSGCEYCQLPSALYPAPFQIDHIIARQHGGATASENLALACIHCNRYKGPNIAGIYPESGALVRLFNPRNDVWNEHFVWDAPRLTALTSIGRVTIQVLAINNAEMIALREALVDEGSVRW